MKKFVAFLIFCLLGNLMLPAQELSLESTIEAFNDYTANFPVL